MTSQKLTDQEWQLVKFRIIQSMPSTVKLAIGDIGSLSKDDVIMHLSEKDEIGEMIVRMQLNLLRSFKKLQ